MPFNAGQGGGYNGAFAGAAAGPGFTHQVAAIDPVNRVRVFLNLYRLLDVP